MKRIIIDIDIQNILEIIKKRKGRISAFLARYLVREENVREEVERRVVDEVERNIKKTLKIKLNQEGIKARLNVRQADENTGK
ncbi:hypothetical protein [Natronogracilivirga saccharolytica]|uniref:Uncharacterized protein n=1 Tax=Natronogracilivirga saccharolytica TaxID=2812953 RepID=A0A8J7UTH1_9BACT|nr:hypothetical protein [Natronogracilivirga saccharolytica]MBP3192606.1 hypothetical protein [Natronogracilivirga saccharolytica]